jgi:hypothetical protein
MITGGMLFQTDKLELHTHTHTNTHKHTFILHTHTHTHTHTPFLHTRRSLLQEPAYVVTRARCCFVRTQANALAEQTREQTRLLLRTLSHFSLATSNSQLLLVDACLVDDQRFIHAIII